MTSSSSAAFRRPFARIVRAGFLLIIVAWVLASSSAIGAVVPKQHSADELAAAQPAMAPASVRANSLAGDALVLNPRLPTLGSLALRAHLQVAAAAAGAATAAAEPICDVFANGYDEVGATPCAGCFDATADFDETDVDCGGVYCKACGDGKLCAVGGDCSSTVCNTSSHLCAPATCINGIKDGTETGIDCGGGICPACGNTQSCVANSDCLSNACDANSNTCVASQCIDHHKDGSETGIDCGGGTCPTCPSGTTCSVDADCTSTACDFVTGVCATSKCTDQRKDGAETGIDCGGGTCPTCGNGQSCSANSDCSSNACDANSNTCVASQCTDHHKDGQETAVDCGGGTCPDCGNGLACLADSDCLSNACDGLSLLCVADQCSDHRKDGFETDIDCGGAGACARCSVGKTCLVNGDCSPGHFCNAGHTCQ